MRLRPPTGPEVANAALVCLTVAPWVLAAHRARQAAAAAPLQAVAWYQLAAGCRWAAYRIGGLGLLAEAHYGKVMENAR